MSGSHRLTPSLHGATPLGSLTDTKTVEVRCGKIKKETALDQTPHRATLMIGSVAKELPT